MNANEQISDAPWYRQFWPWVLIALPASAVIAGFITLWLVLQKPDREVPHEAQVEHTNEVLGRSSVVPPSQ